GRVAPFRRQWALSVPVPLRFVSMEHRRQRRTALMVDRQGGTHEVVPNIGRHGAATDFAQRLIVVATDPHTNHQIARKTNEQGVAILLRRTGLPERRDGERSAAASSIVGGSIKKIEHWRPVALAVERSGGSKESRQPFGRLLT